MRISSRELAEWQAYERVYGPVGSEWRDETLAQMHELLQEMRYAIIAVNTPQGKQGSIPATQHHPRPLEWFDKAEQEV